jgi:F-type H+-transporting ATPase subunit alpha
MEEQSVSIWAGTTGQLDEVPLEDVRRFETEFLDYLRRQRPEILTTIAETRDLGKDTVETLTGAITDFKGQFETSSGKLLNEAAAEALEPEDVEQEKIIKHVRKPTKES